jgi:drug/metabolite transporter (DMT)-like permease
MSGSYPAYEAVILRCIGSTPVLLVMLVSISGLRSFATPLMGTILLRSVILYLGYLCFVLSLAAIPMASSVAIYFTMPFFVAGLAHPMLGERVRLHRWLAIIAGFIGVLIMVRPGASTLEPAALLALMSAFFYAVGQMMGRPLAQKVQPIVIANWQNVIYLMLSLLLAIIFLQFDFSGVTHKSLQFLTRGWVWPPMGDLLVMLGNGILAAFAMLLFVTAYKNAESNFVAPFEYSAMVWALIYGVLVFGEFPDFYTWIGATIVVAAGLLMIWRDHYLDRAMASKAVFAPEKPGETV